MAFDLSSLQRGKSNKPPRVVVYGEHGIGKSTFASGAPNPVFIQTEDGLANIDTTKFPLAHSYSDVLDALRSLHEESHDFETLVIDSADWLEALIWKHVAQKHDKADIEAFGYGKGYTYAADEFRSLFLGLDALRDDRGMAVILTAHCEVKRHDDPTSEPYDRWQIKLHRHAAGVIQEWADVVGFAAEPVIVRKEDVGFQKKVRRGVSRGERLLHVSPNPAFAAKNRFAMPDSVPLDWGAFVQAMSV